MTLGLTPKQADLLCTTARFCEVRVAPESIYGVLHRECFALFPDEMFADLFTDVGRRSVAALCLEHPDGVIAPLVNGVTVPVQHG